MCINEGCSFHYPRFPAANREPVMCAIIFAAKSMHDDWRTGFDLFAEWVGDPDNLEANIGDGKLLLLLLR